MNIAKIVSITAFVLSVVVVIFFAGLYTGATHNIIRQTVHGVWSDIKTLYHQRDVVRGIAPRNHLNPAVYEGSGVTINKRDGDGTLVLLGGFFDDDNGFRLMRRDGTVVASWKTSLSKIFSDTSHFVEPPMTDWNIDVHGGLMHADGSLVFNFEYGGSARLSRCGDVIWTTAHRTHHEIITSEAGGYWTLGRKRGGLKQFPDVTPLILDQNPGEYFSEDFILRLNDKGEIVDEIPITGTLMKNGLRPVLTAVGLSFKAGSESFHRGELVHSNNVAELPAAMADAFPMFEPGDLMISLRGYNLIAVLDPNDRTLKWSQTGPWIRQHDPEFRADGTISVFNNNAFWQHLAGDRPRPGAEKVSNITVVDPKTGETTIAYGQRPGQEFVTALKGQQDPTPEGGFFIVESQAGRAFEVDANGEIVWEYVNRYDETDAAALTTGRLYPENYFTIDEWQCR